MAADSDVFVTDSESPTRRPQRRPYSKYTRKYSVSPKRDSNLRSESPSRNRSPSPGRTRSHSPIKNNRYSVNPRSQSSETVENRYTNPSFYEPPRSSRKKRRRSTPKRRIRFEQSDDSDQERSKEDLVGYTRKQSYPIPVQQSNRRSPSPPPKGRKSPVRFRKPRRKSPVPPATVPLPQDLPNTASAIFRSSSPGPGEVQNMRIHAGILLNTDSGQSYSKVRPDFDDTSDEQSHAESKICRNLRYNLDQLRIRAQKEKYMSLVENIIVGPYNLLPSETEDILGIHHDLHSKYRMQRKQMIDSGEKLSWTEPDKAWLEPIDSANNDGGRISPVSPRLAEERARTARKRRESMVQHRRNDGWSFRPELRQQFDAFSRFGDSRSDGSTITLTQSDKWLRQAGIIDGWTVTTTDTAIFFRKYSKGSIWLEYSTWRTFLEELATKKGLNLLDVIHKLEMCGKPAYTKAAR